MNPVMQEAGRKAYLTKMANKAAREALAGAGMTGQKFTMGNVEITTTLEPYGMTDEAAKALLTKVADAASGVPTIKAKASPGALDARLPGNTAAHVERSSPGLTGSTARAFRKKTMKACPCRLCKLALNPPVTFAEWALFGLETIGPEHKRYVAMLFATPEEKAFIEERASEAA